MLNRPDCILRWLKSVLFLLCLAGCAQKGNDAIATITVDPKTGLVDEIQCTVATGLLAGNSYFLVQTEAGSSTYWDVESEKTDGDATLVTLHLTSSRYRPAVGNTIWLFLVNPANGKTTRLGTRAVSHAAEGELLNTDFSTWQGGDTTLLLPVAWQIIDSQGHFTVGQLGTTGLRLSATADSKVSSAAFLEQPVLMARGDRIEARLRPSMACAVHDGKLEGFAGISLSDSRGEALYYCVGNGAVQELKNSFHVIVPIPGKVGAWNDVVVDPYSTDVLPYARLSSDEEHPLSVRLGVQASARGESIEFQSVNIIGPQNGTPVGGKTTR